VDNLLNEISDFFDSNNFKHSHFFLFSLAVELEKTVKCGCNPWHFAGGFAPKRESNTDALERIRRCHSEAVTNLHRWKSDILKHFTGQGRHDDGLQSNTTESQQFRPHQLLIQQVESLIRQVTHLFEHKFYQLSIKPDVHDPSSRRKLEESFRKVLTSISEIQIQGPSEDMHNLWERSRVQRWCELIMTLLSDLKKHQILPESPLLSYFLNEETRGQLIWQYLDSRSFRSAHTIYLNFDPKLSLQEDSSTKKFRNIIER
jgi:hypothetical protein